MIGQFRISIHS